MPSGPAGGGARRLAAFVLAGGAGFVCDLGLLTALIDSAGLHPLPARILSVAAAILVTWRLNRALAFGPSGHPQHIESARYFGVALGVACLNYLVFAALLLGVPGMPPALAAAAATLLAMTASFLGYSRLVFRA